MEGDEASSSNKESFGLALSAFAVLTSVQLGETETLNKSFGNERQVSVGISDNHQASLQHLLVLNNKPLFTQHSAANPLFSVLYQLQALLKEKPQHYRRPRRNPDQGLTPPPRATQMHRPSM